MSDGIFGVLDLPSWGLPLTLIVIAVWLWSVVTVARERTKDPNDRLVWLLIVLLLNIVGTLLYLLFGPERSKADLPDHEAEIKRRANEGRL